MKKIDLHIHTVSTPSDKHFSFCMERLMWYVSEGNLDAIAITNHNMFDLKQFQEIKSQLEIKIFPGIEIDIEGTHILVIAEDNELHDFKMRCDRITAMIPDKETSISIAEFREVFVDLSNYLLIPHYKKSPEIKEETLNQLSSFITAGEVTSPRKFAYSIKDKNALVPVCFSDLRMEERLKAIPARQTYIDIGDITLTALKVALSDKHKVHLSREDGHHFFEALNNGLKLSTGLNVVIGERSSGKSHTLNLIANQNDTEDVKIKYIKQFSLLQKDEDDEKEFSKNLTTTHSRITEDYLKEFKECVDIMRDVDITRSNRELNDFIESLLKHASETDRLDTFAKAKLFTESKFTIDDLSSLKKLVQATMSLADSSGFKEIINRHISDNSLRLLIIDLIIEHNKNYAIELKKSFVNDIIDNIQFELKMHTSASPINEINLYKLALDQKKIDKFNALCKLIKQEKEFLRNDIQGFSKIAKRNEFNNARDIGSTLGKQLSFVNAFSQYDSKGFTYLEELRKIESLAETDYHKLFTKISYNILNASGYQVSGGERSEYRLLQEISDASQYDLLLIDEPESSFDNRFLFQKVNTLIKEISGYMPVILVTHNSTVGASIKPDYLVYTSKSKDFQGKEQYELYTGYPTDKVLVSLNGKETNNHAVLLNCLEAGSEPYLERRKGYEVLEN
ncbi:MULTISPECIES: PHP domain-containing protein [Acinetobacter calcoaceticus/baumannii complex]|uniref:PHP domain-containing protein n=1 Tax=Acinetobacter calcoaceticus/baumannii complex TaxID=909768 RepID=UPI00029E0F8F|nr:PHP domain-containing protein [Acinetobacter pittii]EKU50606.1 PHP domain protein [Acinetobacter sp. WC-323]